MHLAALPALHDNYIWLLADDHGRALVVDPGQAEPVLAACQARGLEPAAILLTHHHPDHCGGVAGLLGRWPGLPVLAPRDARIGQVTRHLAEGDRFELLGLGFRVLEVPGHTRSHVALVDDDDRLFSGDTLFSLGCGRLFEGTPAQMLGSLDRLAALAPATLLCCGHEYTLANAAFARVVEPDNDALRHRTEEAQAMRKAGHPTLPSTLASELACNPFLRVDQAAVREAVERRIGRDCADRVEVFAQLRAWKDGFPA